jgi:ATP synthase protein I
LWVFDIEVLAMKSKLPKIQLTIILMAIAYFSTLGAGLSAAYGGLISLMNTGLVDRHTNKQKTTTMSVQASVGMMAYSVIMRMTMVVGLTLAGYFYLELSPNALIVSLILGLIGFLMDKVLQK